MWSNKKKSVIEKKHRGQLRGISGGIWKPAWETPLPWTMPGKKEGASQASKGRKCAIREVGRTGQYKESQ